MTASSAKVPTFRKEELAKISNLTSFNYAKFINNPKECLEEKILLYKARLIFEDDLLKAIEAKAAAKDDDARNAITEEMRSIYTSLGHFNLLAQDYARALSAYQKAYKLSPEDYWKDAAGLYGLGIVYFHFRAFKAAIETFCQLIYCHPFSEVATEACARLGVAFKSVDNFTQSLKLLLIALSDVRESPLLPRYQIRFQVAHCYDCAGDFRRAAAEYNKLLKDNDQSGVSLPRELVASIHRQLGWLCFRQDSPHLVGHSQDDWRRQKLQEAIGHLNKSKELAPSNGRTHCYLGRCFSEICRVGANDADKNTAFTNYRFSIDSDESDANTWCSIGVLYQRQSQFLDALQAFSCAVQLDAENSAAWTDLGGLYESQRQYKDALYCFKKAVQFNPDAPESLKQRIVILEKEITTTERLLSLGRNPPPPPARNLPSPEDSWTLGIPSQVRQRQADNLRQLQNRYREGSPLWGMSELAAHALRKPFCELDPTQRQIMQVLKINKEQLEHSELNLLKQLEERYADIGGAPGTHHDGINGKLTRDGGVPSVENVKREAPEQQQQSAFPMVSQDDLEDVLGDTSAMMGRTDPSLCEVAGPADDELTSRLTGFSGNETANSIPSTSASAFVGDFNLKQDAEGSKHDTHAHHHDGQQPTTSGDLPPNFSLLAPISVPITVTSSEILDLCKKRHERSAEYKPVFDEKVPPPRPPKIPEIKMPTDKLKLQTPIIMVESPKDAHTIELQNFCYNSPIALVRGMTQALKIDLGQFSTKTLIQTAPDHEVEVRTQFRMPGDVNLDNLGRPTWECYSIKSFTNITRYGQYQAESFRHSLKEETEKLRQTTGKAYAAAANASAATTATNAATDQPTAKKRKTGGGMDECEPSNIPTKMLKFGTNVDLSDEHKFRAQLKELDKMPPFCRIQSGCNLLTHLGYKVLGMNTVQLYMKVPGSRTPGHLENNCFASINVNIGPGECEWFGIPYEYWPAIEALCKKNNLDFLKGAWWPNIADLERENIPYYKFTQKAGDLVWVSGGCVHWVQSTGWCNNIAWNVGPMTATQIEMACFAHEWNKLNTYRSLVPMQHLAWQLARNVRFSNQKMFNLVKGILIRSLAYCRMVADFIQSTAKSTIKFQARTKGEIAHYCHLCEIEVFNVLFVKEIGGKFRVFCVQCARKDHIDDFVALQQVTFEELSTVFDQFQLHPARSTLIC